jgi:anoctamin-10
LQNLGVVAIVTNCALLVCLYDDAGRWKIEPGLAAILMLEHLLLLAKFGFSWFVPEVCILLIFPRYVLLIFCILPFF